jgi:tRNA nucleotidyltransferase (CCA-adding enzyme)
LQEISGERLRNEFDLILAESARGAILQQLQEYAILPAIHPALHFDTDAAQRLARLPSDQLPAGWQLEEADRLGLAYLLWLSDLVLEEAGSLAERLRFTRSLQTALEGLIKLRSHLADLAEASPSQVVDQLEKAPDLTLYALALLEDDPRTRNQIEAYVMKWKYVQVGVNGNDLLQRGLPPGPRYAHILKRLRRAWLDGEVGSPDEEHALLDTLLREDG